MTQWLRTTFLVPLGSQFLTADHTLTLSSRDSGVSAPLRLCALLTIPSLISQLSELSVLAIFSQSSTALRLTSETLALPALMSQLLARLTLAWVPKPLVNVSRCGAREVEWVGLYTFLAM